MKRVAGKMQIKDFIDPAVPFLWLDKSRDKTATQPSHFSEQYVKRLPCHHNIHILKIALEISPHLPHIGL